MKKVLVLGVAALFLTGCGNKNQVVCKGKMSEDGQKIEMKVTGTLKSDKISKVSAEMTFSKKDTAKQMCSLLELANSMAEKDQKIDFKCDGKTLKIEDYTKYAEGDDIIGSSKADFIKAMETEKLTCK